MKPTDETYLPFHLNPMYEYSGPFDKAIPVAEHYGFRLVKPITSKGAVAVEPTIAPSRGRQYKADLSHKFSSLSYYLENQETLSNPALLCHTKSAKTKNGFLNLDVYGVADSFVETLLLKSAYEILTTEGYKNLGIEINSFGSAESFERFDGEVTKFVTKFISKFSKKDQEKLRESKYYIYKIEEDREEELSDALMEVLLHRPRPIAHLSELCRLHLKELLEHLEETGVCYHLNPHLFPRSGKHAETVYTIVNQDKNEVLAYGERFTTQAKTQEQDLMADKEGIVHCAAISIAMKGGKAEKYQKSEETKIKQKCFVYFAHSGAIAKRNTLNILTALQDGGINVKHSVVKNSLREQLYHSERQQSEGISYPITLILGVKEVQDGTILVRNNLANRQKAVPISRMCSYLRTSLKSVKKQTKK